MTNFYSHTGDFSMDDICENINAEEKLTPREWKNGWPPGYFESIESLEIDQPIDFPPEPVSPID